MVSILIKLLYYNTFLISTTIDFFSIGAYTHLHPVIEQGDSLEIKPPKPVSILIR